MRMENLIENIKSFISNDEIDYPRDADQRIKTIHSKKTNKRKSNSNFSLIKNTLQ